MSSGGVYGGVWKKVKSKEKSGRCICVGEENWEKTKKGKNIFYWVDILF